MSTLTDRPALAQELRRAAQQRQKLADAHLRRAEHYRTEAKEMRVAAARLARKPRATREAEAAWPTHREGDRG
jgi:hypothetical protein